ncbi:MULTISPECIES: hypothetical protein [Bacillus]|uniref:DUF1877 family protein n=2 Tax=Bacillus TaxID=1386 RepID=A0AAJ3YX25_9BACI|nr:MULTISPECIES: hypothetical protein [Bacillus]KKB73304.1 hypothetical protein TH62_12480 [Bacillus sp. TH008]MDU0069508.1 hypothetical protein [Bacillus sp. IG6]MED8017512.1 hypothetical protein [Bacillus glycinifermentans]QAT64658.1 hypothetical protein EQZ20_06885 [Bacillus glycinifermentans]WKB78609.1 hypothetical protein QYM22_07110 [Bacillus glycinifermentans]
MIEIIYGTDALEGSCYIEILPDKYRGKCWNTSSIYFTGDNFGYMMPAFEKCYKPFDYFAFNEMDTDTWKLIMKELEVMKQNLINDPDPHSLKDVLGFPFVYSEEEFLENHQANIKQLISMISEFQTWIEEKSDSTQFISVLGM